MDCIWNSSGQITGVGSLSHHQGIFPTQGQNPGLLHCSQILYQLSHKGTLFFFKVMFAILVFFYFSIKFQINISSSTVKLIRILIQDCLIGSIFRRIKILIILSLLVHRHCISLDLFRSSILLNNVLYFSRWRSFISAIKFIHHHHYSKTFNWFLHIDLVSWDLAKLIHKFCQLFSDSWGFPLDIHAIY